MSSALKNLHVLHCDDEKMMQRLVTGVLQKLGFTNVTHVNSGRKAIELLTEKKFDFIITDWRMGDMDGIDIVKYIRSPANRCPPTPVIMLTGNTEVHYVTNALNYGIEGYVIKPFTAEKLTQQIRKIIEHPQPYLVTADYQGPNRRRQDKGPPPTGERRKSKPKKN